MTITADRTKLRLVNILIAVTINARHGNFRVGIAAVAITALRLGVGTSQCKSCVFVVVKLCLLPAVIGMTVLTFRTKAPSMNILNGMTDRKSVV